MSNRIVIRNKAPHQSTIEFWVAPKDQASVGSYAAAVTMVNSKNEKIFDNEDITGATEKKPLVSPPLVAGEVYSVGIKVAFNAKNKRAITNHRIRKKNKTVFGALFPHEVPETNAGSENTHGVGRQTIGIAMIKG